MKLLHWVKTYSSLVVAGALVVFVVLPADYPLPEFFLTLGLALLIFKELAEIKTLASQSLLETRALKAKLSNDTSPPDDERDML